MFMHKNQLISTTLAVLALAAGWATPSHAQSVPSSEVSTHASIRLADYDDSIYWVTDPQEITSALQAAADSGRPVMVVYHADWCPWCVKMDEDTFSDETVISLSRHFLCIRIDTTTPYGQALAQRMGVQSIPYVQIYHNGRVDVVKSYEDADTFAQDILAAL